MPYVNRAPVQDLNYPRDADVTVRWGVASVLGALVGLALLMFGGFADVGGEISDVRRELGELSAQIDARFDVLLENVSPRPAIPGAREGNGGRRDFAPTGSAAPGRPPAYSAPPPRSPVSARR